MMSQGNMGPQRSIQSDSKTDWASFYGERDRERGLISQSNARAAAVAAIITAVWSAAGIAAALILPMQNVSFTALSYWLGGFTVLLMVGQLFAMMYVMWPRGLNKLPRDRNLAVYLKRHKQEAQKSQAVGTPTDDEVSEGFFLQVIRLAKERGTQVSLVFTGGFVLVALAFFGSLNY